MQVAVPLLGAGQEWSQPPQLATSLFASTHLVPQRMKPALHWNVHLAPLQRGAAFAGALHTVPQAPQFDVSVARSAQASSQGVLLPQSVAHCPERHTSPPPQAAPHLPQ